MYFVYSILFLTRDLFLVLLVLCGCFCASLGCVQKEIALIDDLLDTTRIASGKFMLSPEMANIQRVLAESVELTKRGDMGDKHIKFETDFTAASTICYIDPNRVGQVFSNLLRNAVKFTPKEGTITIRAYNDDPPTRFVVTISDNGIGIPQDSLTTLFQLFQQGT